MKYKRAWKENNGFIDNTMLPFLICKQVIPSPNLVLKAPLDFGYKNIYFKGEEPDYKKNWSIWKTWMEIDPSTAPTAGYI